MQNVDVFFIIDASYSSVDYSNILNRYIRLVLNGMIGQGLTDGKINVYVNLFIFNDRFDPDTDILIGHKLLRNLDIDRIRTIHIDGATDPEKVLRAAFSQGMSQYFEWISSGCQALTPFYFYLSDGYVDCGAYEGMKKDKREQEDLLRRYKAVAKELRIYQLKRLINFYACGIETRARKPNWKLLSLLVPDPGKLICRIDLSNYVSSATRFSSVIAGLIRMKSVLSEESDFKMLSEYERAAHDV